MDPKVPKHVMLGRFLGKCVDMKTQETKNKENNRDALIHRFLSQRQQWYLDKALQFLKFVTCCVGTMKPEIAVALKLIWRLLWVNKCNWYWEHWIWHGSRNCLYGDRYIMADIRSVIPADASNTTSSRLPFRFSWTLVYLQTHSSYSPHARNG